MTTSLGKLRSTSIRGGKPGRGLLTLSPWRVASRSGYKFANVEAAQIVARFSKEPNSARKAIIDNLWTAFKAAGLVGKLDALWLMAAHDPQAARQNWMADEFNLTPVSSPIFTLDRGYATDGSASYLETGVIPATAAGLKFTQTSGSIGFWSRTTAQAGIVDMGNTSTLLTARNSSDFRSHRVNWSVSGSGASNDGSGHFVTSRLGSLNTDNALYRNAAVAMGSVSAGSLQALENEPIRIGRRGGASNFSARQFSVAHIGAGLTAQNITDLYNALNTYLTAIGAT